MNSIYPQESSWIFLDAGDTFVYGYPTLYEAIQDCWRLREAWVDRADIQEAVRRFQRVSPPTKLSSQRAFKEYFAALYRDVLNRLDFPGPIDEAVAYLWGEWSSGKRLRLFDDALSALKMLRRSGFQLGVVSNWDESFEPSLKRLGVWDLFELRIASTAVGVAKPDEAIFHLALNEAQTRAETCWFIGDQLEVDILPAASLGMRVAWVDYYGKANPADAERADIYAPSLSLAAWRILHS